VPLFSPQQFTEACQKCAAWPSSVSVNLNPGEIIMTRKLARGSRRLAVAPNQIVDSAEDYYALVTVGAYVCVLLGRWARSTFVWVRAGSKYSPLTVRRTA
jgi:hypothetical protein